MIGKTDRQAFHGPARFCKWGEWGGYLISDSGAASRPRHGGAEDAEAREALGPTNRRSPLPTNQTAAAFSESIILDLWMIVLVHILPYIKILGVHTEINFSGRELPPTKTPRPSSEHHRWRNKKNRQPLPPRL